MYLTAIQYFLNPRSQNYVYYSDFLEFLFSIFLNNSDSIHVCAFLIVTILQDSLNYLHFMEVS